MTKITDSLTDIDIQTAASILRELRENKDDEISMKEQCGRTSDGMVGTIWKNIKENGETELSLWADSVRLFTITLGNGKEEEALKDLNETWGRIASKGFVERLTQPTFFASALSAPARHFGKIREQLAEKGARAWRYVKTLGLTESGVPVMLWHAAKENNHIDAIIFVGNEEYWSSDLEAQTKMLVTLYAEKWNETTQRLQIEV